MADNDNTPPQPDPSSGGGSNYQTFTDFTASAATLLTNIQLPDVWANVKGRGYEVKDITDAQARLQILGELDEAQKKEYGEQYGATEAYDKARAALHKTYINHLGFARLAFKNDVSAQTAMGLNGKRKVSQSGYVAQGKLLYDNALKNAAWKAALAKRGIDEAALTATQSAFGNLSTLSAAQQKESGEAQEATKKRDAAYDELHDFIHDLRETAKLALTDFPQMREQLGIKEAS